MLEFFRHHRGAFMIFLTVIIIISFSVWGGWTRTQGGGLQSGDRVFTMYGRDYNKSELERFQRLFEVARSLGMFFPIELVMTAMDHQSRDAVPLDFAFNLLVLQRQMDELGVYPSDEEALQELRGLQAFQDAGKFDEGRAAMIEENLARFGFRSSDLLDLARQAVAFRKIRELVTRNYQPSDFAAEKRYISMYHTVNASTIAFKLEEFKKDLKVEDSEIEKEFEDKKDSLKTSERRKVRWVRFDPPAGLEEIEDASERAAKTREFNESVRAFATATHDEGARLEPLAAERGLKVETTDFFEAGAAPEALEEASDLSAAVFLLDPDTRIITDPLKADAGAFIIAELMEVEEPRQQELAEVRETLVEGLTEKKAREAMATAVNEAREALGKKLDDGMSLEDAAKEMSLMVSELPEFSPNIPPADVPNAYDIAREAGNLAVGKVSKPLTTDEGVLLVIATHKELRKRPEGDTTREGVGSSQASSERDQIFRAWFARQKELARLQLLVQFT